MPNPYTMEQIWTEIYGELNTAKAAGGTLAYIKGLHKFDYGLASGRITSAGMPAICMVPANFADAPMSGPWHRKVQLGVNLVIYQQAIITENAVEGEARDSSKGPLDIVSDIMNVFENNAMTTNLLLAGKAIDLKYSGRFETNPQDYPNVIRTVMLVTPEYISQRGNR